MARYQRGIVWEDCAQQVCGIFQIHEAVLGGSVRHTQYSLFNLVGLNSGAILTAVVSLDDPRSGQNANSCGDECHPLPRLEIWYVGNLLTRVGVRLARWSFDALPSKKTSVDGP